MKLLLVLCQCRCQQLVRLDLSLCFKRKEKTHLLVHNVEGPHFVFTLESFEPTTPADGSGQKVDMPLDMAQLDSVFLGFRGEFQGLPQDVMLMEL